MQITDMTKGNPLKLLLTFALPVLAGNLFQLFYNMVDTLVVGRFVGVEALAAVGSAGNLVWLMVELSFGLTLGFSMIISQQFGAGNPERVRKAVGLSVVLSLVIALLITIVGVSFTEDMLKLMQTPDNVFSMAAVYTRIMMAGITAGIFYNLFSSILRALGNAKAPLYFLIMSSVLNIILDLVFVLCFHWDVMGVAVATVISQTFSAVISGIYTFTRISILKMKKSDFAWEGAMAKELIRMGLPCAFQGCVICLGVMVLQVVVNIMGSEAMAGYTVTVKVQQFFTEPLFSVGAAVGTFVGQNFGANKFDRIRSGFRWGVVITTGISLIGFTALHLYAKEMALIFVTDSTGDVSSIVSLHLGITSCFYIILGILVVSRYSLQGMGNSMLPMLSSFVEVLVRVPICLLLYTVLKFGYPSVPISDVVTWTVTGIYLYLSYRLVYRHKKGEQEKKIASECP